MPILIPPPPAAEVRPVWGGAEAPSAQGIEGQQVRDEIQKVICHWTDRPSQSDVTTTDEGRPYEHVPFEKVATRKVRYTQAEPLRPRRFLLDDE